MLSGKNFPQKVKALCRCRESTDIIFLKNIHYNTSKVMASKSKTTKLLVDMLIKPVFIIILSIRAEREADWPLHLEAFKIV